MKVGLVRHFKVLDSHKYLLTSDDFDKWIKEYDKAKIEYKDVRGLNNDKWDICYTSNLYRAIKTADHVFTGKIIKTDLLKEVQIAPFTEHRIYLPHHLWLLLGRLLYLINHKSQPEKLTETRDRVRTFVRKLMCADEKNVLIISHGFLMRYIVKELYSLGFKGNKFRRPENGKLYVFEKQKRI